VRRAIAYLEAIKLRLVIDPLVARFTIVRERIGPGEGYLRVRLELRNGDIVEAAEHFELGPVGFLPVHYRHHWMTPQGHLRVRWDNAPHFPSLSTFPHHIHEGNESQVVPGRPMSILDLLDEIAARLSQ
jgi:hypothetical protein